MKKLPFWKPYCLVGLLTITMLTVPIAPALADGAKPTGDMSISVLNRYIWRGYELSRNSAVVQPSVTVGYQGFTANLSGNFDTKPYSAGTAEYAGTWNETDLTLSYSKTLELFTIGAGYTYYGLEPLNKDAADRDVAQEVFATVTLNTLLSPTLTAYREIAHYHSLYTRLGISHVIEFSPRVSLKLAASASHLTCSDPEKYPKYDGNAVATTDKYVGLHDGTVSASLPIRLTDHVTITPTFSYIFPLAGAASDEMKGRGLQGTASPADRESSFLVGGVTSSFTF